MAKKGWTNPSQLYQLHQKKIKQSFSLELHFYLSLNVLYVWLLATAMHAIKELHSQLFLFTTVKQMIAKQHSE